MYGRNFPAIFFVDDKIKKIYFTLNYSPQSGENS